MRLDHTLVQIRERNVLEVMDLALVVWRARPVAITLAAVAGIAPWALLNAWLTSAAEEDWLFYQLYCIALEAPFATAPITVLMGGLMFGARPSPLRILRTVLARSVPMFLFAGLLRGVLVLILLLTWLVPTRFPFLGEVILLERGRWRKIVNRCSDLTSDRAGDLFAQWAAIIFFGGAFSLAFSFALGNLESIVNSEELTWEDGLRDSFLSTRWLVGVWIAVAFSSLVRFLGYIDQRIRLEGWEVELRLRAAAETMRREMEP